ncbi:hypothetical protein ACH4FX_37190 [Streptomyces sp. NPDC018019]|uniref:hypothetical protein n=1 Tax=Streptomyces sp. NPDC018019 TaxID=3365030 RepID=UPI00378E9752
MSRRYWIASVGHFTVRNITPFVVLAIAAVSASLVPALGAQGPSDLIDLHSQDGAESWLVAISVVALWTAFAEPRLRKAIDRWYLDGAPPDEWLAFFGLKEAWRTPAITAADFRQEHGDPVEERWDAAAYEVHQNLAASRDADGRSTQD